MKSLLLLLTVLLAGCFHAAPPLSEQSPPPGGRILYFDPNTNVRIVRVGNVCVQESWNAVGGYWRFNSQAGCPDTAQ